MVVDEHLGEDTVEVLQAMSREDMEAQIEGATRELADLLDLDQFSIGVINEVANMISKVVGKDTRVAYVLGFGAAMLQRKRFDEGRSLDPFRSESD